MLGLHRLNLGAHGQDVLCGDFGCLLDDLVSHGTCHGKLCGGRRQSTNGDDCPVLLGGRHALYPGERLVLLYCECRASDSLSRAGADHSAINLRFVPSQNNLKPSASAAMGAIRRNPLRSPLMRTPHPRDASGIAARILHSQCARACIGRLFLLDSLLRRL
jgi:hypothetical protein